MSPAGRAVCLILALVLATTAPGWRAAAACGVIVVLAAIASPASLATLRSRRFWLFLILLLVPAALFLGGDAQEATGLAFSMSGLQAGVVMALRAIGIMVAVSGFAASVSVTDLGHLLERLGMRGLGFALGIAVNMLPTVQSNLTTAYQALRLRGGLRRPWMGLRLLLVTVAANSLRHADDIVGSAEARAFSPDRLPAVRLTWSAADWRVIVVLIVTMAAVWLV